MKEALAQDAPSRAAKGERPLLSRPAPPAGWYKHPNMANTQRYWDGERWTDHVAPGTPQPPGGVAQPTGTPPLTDKGVDSSYAWLIALAPLAAIAITYFVPGTGTLWLACIGLWIVTTYLAESDNIRLKARGMRINGALPALLVPAYLFSRAGRTGTTPAIPIVWLGTAGLFILGTFTFLDSTDFDGDLESSRIEQSMTQKGIKGASVICPDRATRPGDTFTCTVDGNRYVSLISITVEENGSYKWEAE
jgi:hypothetical protein